MPRRSRRGAVRAGVQNHDRARRVVVHEENRKLRCSGSALSMTRSMPRRPRRQARRPKDIALHTMLALDGAGAREDVACRARPPHRTPALRR
jgi:hypothetical protein